MAAGWRYQIMAHGAYILRFELTREVIAAEASTVASTGAAAVLVGLMVHKIPHFLPVVPNQPLSDIVLVGN
jgi:hypothetical protein